MSQDRGGDKGRRFVFLWLVGALAGYIALSYEILWYRAWSFTSLGAPAVFGALLGAYLLGIANGALRARRYCLNHPATGEPRQLLRLAYYVIFLSPISFLVVPALAFLSLYCHWFPLLIVVVFATSLWGAILPLIAHFGVFPDERAGERLSYFYVANIVGSTLGSLVTGFGLLDAFPLRTIACGLAILSLVFGLALLLAAHPSRRVIALGCAVVIGGAAAAVQVTDPLYGDLWERLQLKEKYQSQMHFAEVIENRSGVITVTPDGSVYGGGAYDGRINTGLALDRNYVVRAYALGALHPAPREILMIGLASGSWAQVISHLPTVDHLTVVEINPGYLQMIAYHPEVSSLLSNPRVSLVTDDGRRWLSRHPQRRFDAIVINTTWHYRAMTTNLLSVEFLELARSRLLAGGLVYWNTTESEEAVKTATTVFAHTLQYRNFIAGSDAPLSFDLPRWRTTLVNFRIGVRPLLDLSQPFDSQLLEKLMGEIEHVEIDDKLIQRTASARVITDDNMATEWQASVPAAVAPFGFLRGN